jgi:hypothetical protein
MGWYHFPKTLYGFGYPAGAGVGFDFEQPKAKNNRPQTARKLKKIGSFVKKLNHNMQELFFLKTY